MDRGGRPGCIVFVRCAGLRRNAERKDGNLQLRRQRSEARGRGPQELMAKCMSNKDAPRGKPVTPAPKAQ